MVKRNADYRLVELDNGATVIDCRTIKYLGEERLMVLCVWRGEYVSWQMNDIEGEAYWGHYFGDSLSKAVEDFEKRCEV